MPRARGWVIWSIAWALPALVGGCAAVPHDTTMSIDDPNEQANRRVLDVNQAVLRPVAQAIKTVVPGPVRDRVHDLNSNLKEPRIFVNNVLQFRIEAALHTAARFTVNSTVGLAGLFDVAGQTGLPQESGDFGQTLFVWGIAEGPYMVQPYFGPATLRDAVGRGVDFVTNPIGWMLSTHVTTMTSVGTGSLGALDDIGNLKSAEDASIDFYSFLRSSYYQMRRAQMREALGLPSEVASPATEDFESPAVTDTKPPEVKKKPRPPAVNEPKPPAPNGTGDTMVENGRSTNGAEHSKRQAGAGERRNGG